MKWPFLFKAHKKVVWRSQVCRTALIRSTLESTDPGASTGGSNLQTRHSGQNIESCSNGLAKIRDSGPPSDFKRRRVGLKVSENEFCPTVTSARITTFQEEKSQKFQDWSFFKNKFITRIHFWWSHPAFYTKFQQRGGSQTLVSKIQKTRGGGQPSTMSDDRPVSEKIV